MREYFYLARQAILDKNNSIMAYELLYRDSEHHTNINNARHATASVLVNVLNQSGLKSIVGKHLTFINVDDSFLRHDFIESIPSATFVFELTATSTLDERTVESVEQLYRKNYRFSLDLDSYRKMGILKELAPYLSYVKIDAEKFEVEFLEAFIKEFRGSRINFIASKVEEEKTFEKFQKAGCSAFQGYYFAKPKIIKNKKLDTKQAALFRLCNVIQSGASISEIVQAFEESPAITLQLLQFINSGAFHFRNRITSVHQLITLLGRNTLVQWLMLLLYSKSFNNDTKDQSPLILMVKQRTEIMVNLMKIIKKSSSQTEQSEAYFVGILSLMDTLMHISLRELVSEFHVGAEVRDALFSRSGLLGELYSVTLAIEKLETERINAFINKYGVSRGEFEKTTLKAFEETAMLETA